MDKPDCVPFIDLDREYREVGQEVDDAVKEVMKSGSFILGDQVDKFEKEFSEYLGANHGVGVNSGTDALRIALSSVGVGTGDEVVTVSHSFISTANAVMEVGAEPVFVDVERDTYLMDTSVLEDKITENTAAIVPVHLYGQPVDMEAVMEVAERHSLYVVEDACQAHGAEYRGEKVGTVGDVGCFSFYPVKNLGAYGDGGFIATDNAELAQKMKILRNNGESEKYVHPRVGLNSRLDEVQAAVLRQKLGYLDEWNERRRSFAEIYDQLLQDTEVVIPEQKNDSHVYHLYVIRHEERDKLQEHLSSRNVDTMIHYPIPIHQQEPYTGFEPPSGLPVTEKVTDEILSLPLNPWIIEEEVRYVAEKISSFGRF